ncbi:MAG: ribosomal L7Ae/L30e/S12e/Gadd45 family protein [Clostridia bacterium]|nr:ribosomal L7Ae/L30e/S12e/Gadd45 family protein [Clostridia bacterium]
MDKQLLLFGLMKKAGRLSVGDEPVTDALTYGDARVTALASDAADNTVRRFERLAGEVNVPVVHLKVTKSELGESLGRASAAVIAVCDIGFAARFLELACEENPDDEELIAAREKMTQKAERLVEEQKKKRKEEKDAKKHPFKARNQAVQNAEKSKPKAEEKSVTYEKRDSDVRTYVPDYKPKKVYGKAPGRQKTAVSIGDRRREDAEKKAGKAGYGGYKSGYQSGGYNSRQGSKGKQNGGSYSSRSSAHGKGGKTK